MRCDHLTPEQALEYRARRRAGLKLGWFIHLSVFLAVNLALWAFASAAAHPWPRPPSLAWAVALMIHGLVVFFFSGGAGLHERLIRQERKRLSEQQQNW